MTNTEKLILYNQYEILKKLDPENSEYEEFQNILISGYTCLYHNFCSWGFEDEIENIDEIYQSMVNILNMYRHINKTQRDTDDENVRNLIEEKRFYFSFQGFDANNDVRWGLLNSQKNLGSWSEINDDFNSHGFNPNYEEMLLRYYKIPNYNNFDILSYDQLKQLLPEHERV